MIRPFLCLTLLLPVAACGPEAHPIDDLTDEVSVRAKVESETFSAELLSATPLAVGRNVVTYRITEKASNTRVTDAVVTHLPTMHMAEKSHSSPFAEPVLKADEWIGEIVFTMPSGELGTWDVAITIARDGSEPETLTFEAVTVADSDARRDLVVGEGKYIVTLNFDETPKVGVNPFTLTVHERAGMMGGFPPITDLTVRVTPEMPTMGHGSSGNVDPIHQENGNYRGEVNLTMSGLWIIDFVLLREGVPLGEVHYELEL